MANKREIGVAGLLASGLLIGIGIVDPHLAGTLAEVVTLTGIQLVPPLPNLGDVVSLLSSNGWAGRVAGFLVAAVLTLAALNLAFRVADRLQSD